MQGVVWGGSPEPQPAPGRLWPDQGVGGKAARLLSCYPVAEIMRAIAIVGAAALAAGASLPVFEDVTARTGIAFRHDKSGTSRKYLIESVSGGVAMLDYDGDGWLDLYFVNGARFSDPMKAGAVPDKSDPKYWNRLYRNRHDGTFEDVTEKAGVRGIAYGMGAAAGDFDSDGHVDLYVTGFPRNTLYRNRGDGTFEDVTEKAAVAGGGWSTSAAWIDFDNDGRLDLIVCRYLKWDFEPDLWCGARAPGYRSYCHPDQFPPITPLVYRNLGAGRFEDVTAKAGFGNAPGKGLGIAINDFDRDGRVDVVIANDSYPQQLFRNLGNGTFREMGLEAGIAYDDEGHTYAGMGVDFADYNHDGWPDVIIDSLATQRYALYRNDKGSFDYASPAMGVATITKMRSGWGMKFLDYDNDGWPDVLVAQGHVMDNIQLTQPALRYLEPLLLMRNLQGRFADVSAQSGDAFSAAHSARGAAYGDLDNDGWIDVAINCNNSPPVILKNKGGNGNHWITIRTRGAASNRDGIGAKVRIAPEGGPEQHALVSTAGSYLASNDPRVHFGLGVAARIKLIEIKWPSGVVQRVENVQADRIVEVTEPRK